MAGIIWGQGGAAAPPLMVYIPVRNIAFIAAHVVLVVLILYQCWRCVDLIYFQSAEATLDAVPAFQPLVEQNNQPKYNIEALVQAHLFGQFQSQVKPHPQPQAVNVPVSARSYRIASLAYSEKSGGSSVVIEVKPGEMEFFKEGDFIERGVRLSAARDDSVLIEVNGRTERVEYVRVSQPVLHKVVKSGELRERENQKYDWSWIAKWEELPIDTILEFLGIQTQGQQLVISSVSPLLSNWNVKAGDVLLSINGVPVVNDKRMKAALMPLSESGIVHLLLENGRRRNSVRWQRAM